jgi:hypothetical protein
MVMEGRGDNANVTSDVRCGHRRCFSMPDHASDVLVLCRLSRRILMTNATTCVIGVFGHYKKGVMSRSPGCAGSAQLPDHIV